MVISWEKLKGSRYYREQYSLKKKKKEVEKELSWRSSGQESVLPMQGLQVQSLVRELRSHMSSGVVKLKRKKEKKSRWGIIW